MTIKPCPFCGSTNVQTHEAPLPLLDRSYWSIGCMDCGCAGGVGDTEEEATALWNQRKEVA